MPARLGSSDGIDLDGNVGANIWFEGLTERLIVGSSGQSPYPDIATHFITFSANGANRLPISYLDPIRAYLARA